MINLTLKIGVLWVSVAMFRYAQKMHRDAQDAAGWHIRQWTISLVCGAAVASAGEYALSRGWMPPLLHLLYDTVVNGLILLAIYHGTAVTIEWTQPDRRRARKRSVRRWLGIGGLCMMGLYLPYRFGFQPRFYYAYNGVRGFLFVWFIGFSILWYYRQARATVHVLTRQRMYLMMSACCVCLLYPFTVLPYAEHDFIRPNLVVSLWAGVLFYLGYVTPKRFRKVLDALAPKLADRFLRQNLILLSIISDFYNERPTGRFLLEGWLKRFGDHLNLSARQTDLLVLAAYLLNSGRLEDPLTPSADRSAVATPGGAPSDGEDARVRFHQRSAAFTTQLLGLREIGQMIRHVDERWDGGGVPDGLRGREIPYESRILRLMETFVEEFYFLQDANHALEVVQSEAGRFDPGLIAALEELIHQ